MLANNAILTHESNNYEISQFYYAPQVVLPPDNINTHSLYCFISYQTNWEELVLTSNAEQTLAIHSGTIFFNSNSISLLEATTVNDFRIDLEVISEALPTNTRITAIDEDNFIIYLNNKATKNYIGNFKFKGFLGNDNRVTVFNAIKRLPTPPIQSFNPEIPFISNYFNKCALKVDVENINGGLTYYRNILGYDGRSGTFHVDEPFTDSPNLSETSTVSIVFDNLHPPKPKDTVKYIKDVHKNMIYLKKITSNNISPVIKRINWEEGEIYDYYRDDINLYEKYDDGTPKHKFYVMNKYYQVFKCIWNNSGGISTVEPYFVAGNFDDVTNIFYDPDDGYKWKYMYTIPYGSLQKFMDENWIPVAVGNAPDPLSLTQSSGGIEAINVVEGGQDYDLAYALVDVEIDGDGTGATAFVEVDDINKKIENIVVKTTGANYSYANVVIKTTSYDKPVLGYAKEDSNTSVIRISTPISNQILQNNPRISITSNGVIEIRNITDYSGEYITIESPFVNPVVANSVYTLYYQTIGKNCKAIASISPIGGSGADSISELGCDRVMTTCLFSGTENGALPTDMQIRQIGLISSPLANSTYPLIGNSESYVATTDVIVSNGFGSFTDGELVYQTPNNANIANATFTATNVNFESGPNRLKLVNTKGVPVSGRSIYGASSKTPRTLLQSFDTDLIKYSGRIIYVENREEIQRSYDGLELFRIVIKF